MIPVYLDFLEILQEVFNWIFSFTLGPVITAVLNWLYRAVSEWLVDLFYSALLGIFNLFLRIVAILDQMVTLFSGLGTYFIDGENQNGSLLTYFFEQPGLTRVLNLLTLAGIVLAFLFAAYSVGKSISDSVLAPEYKPVSWVIKSGLKAAFAFVTTPLLCILIVQLTTVVLAQISMATSDVLLDQYAEIYEKNFDGAEYNKMKNSQPGIADILFMVNTQDAIKNKKGAASIYSTKNAFQDTDRVKKNFDYKKINYLPGYLISLFVIVILLLSTLAFIQRMFEILVLYCISPMFTATIPLDGGAKFKKWREMFIARMVSAFGPIFTMKLFLILMPLLTSSKIQLHPTSPMKDYLMKALLVCGGVFSIYKSKNLVIQIISPDSARNIEESENRLKRARLWMKAKASQKSRQVKNSISQKLGGDGGGQGGGGQSFHG